MDTQFEISVDGRTILAQPRPEDQATLDELLRRGESFKLNQPEGDTEGHVLAADEIYVDVEGHAMTLRLPHAADAAALKRALAVGALTATVGIGGFVAGQAVSAGALDAPAATTISQTGSYAASERGPETGSYVVSEKGSGYTGSYVISEKGDTGAASVDKPVTAPPGVDPGRHGSPNKTTDQAPGTHQHPGRE